MKPRGSLTRLPERTGIFGCQPSDRDLMARTRPALDLITGVHFGSDGSGELGGSGRRQRTPATKARGGAARGSLEFHRNQCSGG
jgi:hypothetical protein